MAASAEELAEVDGIGPVTAGHVIDAWSTQGERIARLRASVTVMAVAPPDPTGAEAGPFAGQSFVFTGKLTAGDRKSSQAAVRALGGDTPSGVTQALTYLVVGDEGSPLFGQGRKGSKILKAEKHQAAGAALRIISEAEFAAMVAEASASPGEA